MSDANDLRKWMNGLSPAEAVSGVAGAPSGDVAGAYPARTRMREERDHYRAAVADLRAGLATVTAERDALHRSAALTEKNAAEWSVDFAKARHDSEAFFSRERDALRARVAELEAGLREACDGWESLEWERYDSVSVATIARLRALAGGR